MLNTVAYLEERVKYLEDVFIRQNEKIVKLEMDIRKLKNKKI